MNPLAEIVALFVRELLRSLRSGKAVILATLSFLVGSALALGITRLEESELIRSASDPAHMMEFREQAYSAFVGMSAAHKLVESPLEVAGIAWINVFFCPLLITLIGFDAMSSDLQFRSVRYFTSRARRSSIYLAKMLGVFALISTILLVIASLGWTVVIANGIAAPAVTLKWGVRFWISTLPIVLAWTSIAMLIGSQFKTPMLSLLTTFVGFFGVWVFGVAFSHYFHSEALGWIYPGTFTPMLITLEPADLGKGLAGTLGSTVLTSGLGVYLFTQRDV